MKLFMANGRIYTAYTKTNVNDINFTFGNIKVLRMPFRSDCEQLHVLMVKCTNCCTSLPKTMQLNSRALYERMYAFATSPPIIVLTLCGGPQTHIV